MSLSASVSLAPAPDTDMQPFNKMDAVVADSEYN
jgi:hypothetical protein